MAKTIALAASEATILNDLKIYKGEAPTFSFTMSPVVDITGWTISMTVKRKGTDTSALLSVSGTIVNGPAGTFTVALTTTQTKTTLGVGQFAYDIQRTTSGSENVLSIGRVSVRQESLNA